MKKEIHPGSIKYLVSALVCSAFLVGCFHDDPPVDPQVAELLKKIEQLQGENQLLWAKNATLEHHKAVLIIGCVLGPILFCVGFACGVKKRRAVLEHHETREEVQSHRG